MAVIDVEKQDGEFGQLSSGSFYRIMDVVSCPNNLRLFILVLGACHDASSTVNDAPQLCQLRGFCPSGNFDVVPRQPILFSPGQSLEPFNKKNCRSVLSLHRSCCYCDASVKTVDLGVTLTKRSSRDHYLEGIRHCSKTDESMEWA
jgi:hypothetical protein